MALARAAGHLALGLVLVTGSVTLTGGALPAAPQGAASPAAVQTPPLTDEEKEQFLLKAKIIGTRDAGKGITNSIRATLSDGTLTHDAHIQTIDDYKREFRGRTTLELDFRDSWTFNVAAYKLDRLLGLNMVPVSVPGRYRSDPAAITWWIDDVMMDEGGRAKKKILPPEEKARYWSDQLSLMRLFDQLIYNTDRNMGNMLISSTWRLWLIDHTRAFRKHTTLSNPNLVSRSDRLVLDRLRGINEDVLRRELGKYLDRGQLRSLLARRDRIIERLESRGPLALFDRSEIATAP